MSKTCGLAVKFCVSVAIGLLLSACSISAETQAKMSEYNTTIPTCRADSECMAKWIAARAWVLENASFGIRSEDDLHIATYDAINARSGTAIRVDKVDGADGSFQILVSVECFAAYGCPDELDTKLDFNRVIGAAMP